MKIRRKPPQPDPTLVEAERRVAVVETRAAHVLGARKLWSRDPWSIAVLHAIREAKGHP